MTKSKKELAKFVRKAAALVEANPHKWTRGRFGDSTRGSFCALGAIGQVVHNTTYGVSPFPFGNFPFFEESQASALQKFGAKETTLVSFNDLEAKSPQEVATVLRYTANALEHGGVCTRKKKNGSG